MELRKKTLFNLYLTIVSLKKLIKCNRVIQHITLYPSTDTEHATVLILTLNFNIPTFLVKF